MREPDCFRFLQPIEPTMIDVALGELYQGRGVWTEIASTKLASERRRTMVLNRFPRLPVRLVGGRQIYHAPAEWAGQCVATGNSKVLPRVNAIIDMLMRANGWTRLGIALVSELQPGGEIQPHSDEGEYFDTFHRVHVPLVGDDSSLFTIGDQTRILKVGEAWVIDNKRTHSVRNAGQPGATNRVNLYFDAR